jgi:biotin carboxyl carrier protein
MVRKFKVKVNNKNYDVEVEELSAQQSEQYAPMEQIPAQPKVENRITPPTPKKVVKKTVPTPKPQVSVSEGEVVIESPMAGLIVDVLVSAGKQVKRGDVLLILEAMKMENNILSTKDGIIKSINVSKGQEVEVGAPLIIIE